MPTPKPPTSASGAAVSSRAVFDAAPFPVVVSGLDDGVLLYVNPVALRVMRASPAAALGQRAGGFWADPLDRDALVARLRAEGAVLDQEIRGRRADGSACWLRLSASLVEFEGRPATCTAFADITELKETHARLEESQLRMELARRGAQFGTWDWDVPSGHVVYDEAWAAMLGWRLEELPPRLESWEVLVHPEDMPRVQAALDEHLAGRTDTYATDHRLRHRDGRWIWVRDAGRVMERGPGGGPIRAAGAMVDISASKAAEQALRESERKHRLLVENSHDIIYTLDTSGVFTFASPSYEVQLGWPTALVVGRHFAEFTHPDDLARCRAFLEEVLASGTPRGGFEHRVLHRDGSWHWVVTNAAPFRDEQGRLLGLEGSATDVEVRRTLQARAARAERAASLGVMAAGMAHEINNPLTWAVSGLQYAEERLRELPAAFRAAWPGSPEGGLSDLEAALAEAAQGTARVRDLVADLRALAAGQHSPDARCDLATALDRATRVARHAFRPGVTLEVRLPALPSITASEAELAQLFSGLLVNAGQAAGVRPPAVRVTAELQGDRVVARVEDDGGGIPPALLARVFDPFVTSREVGAGRGLGLPVALGIARGLGGDLTLESEEGRGTVATVTLPVAG